MKGEFEVSVSGIIQFRTVIRVQASNAEEAVDEAHRVGLSVDEAVALGSGHASIQSWGVDSVELASASALDEQP